MPPPTRAAALERLAAFARSGLREYAFRRNHDLGPEAEPTVSRLSPHVRHRLVLESELVATALRAHPGAASEKFVQEVYWRSYWKGWLELRPAVWRGYRSALREKLEDAGREPLASTYAAACAGRTGIDCFDAWVHELVATGYLHNHARMWFASIWSHTLRLPWELGADFFLRHLLDGDPASNTLSWRWVVGLQTPGKIYLARADNIAKYTNGRWSPRGLATHAEVPAAPPAPPPAPLPPAGAAPTLPALLLLHEDDLHAETLGLASDTLAGVCTLDCSAGRSPADVSGLVRDFTCGAIADACSRVGAQPRATASTALDARTAAAGCSDAPAEVCTDATVVACANDIVECCRRDGLNAVVTAYAPVGPAREQLDAIEPLLRAQGITLHRLRREWDETTWPLARRGFFAFAEHIPELLALAR